MRYLSVTEALELHRRLLETSGGSPGIRDLPRLLSALAQPSATFDGTELYADLAAKAATLAFALTQGHPFVDGNKRIGHAALEVFLVLNGYEMSATVDEQETLFLSIASGELDRDSLETWLRTAMVELADAEAG